MDFQELYLNKPLKLLSILKNGFIIDTTILLLFLIGLIDTRKNTKYLLKFNLSIEDYIIFTKFIEASKSDMYITPNILTEFHSLVKTKLGKNFIKNYKADLIPYINHLKERHYNKEKILILPKFVDFGFTDMSIFLATKEEKLNLLTYDRALCGICNTKHGALTIFFPDIKSLSYTIRK